METAIILTATVAVAAAIATYWNKRRHAYGTPEWTSFYRRVAPVLNGKPFKEVGVGMSWLTPYGTVFSHGEEFVVTEYKLKAVHYKGTGDFSNEANFDTLESEGLLKLKWSL